MNEPSYTFMLGPGRRALVLLQLFLLIYPMIVVKFLFLRRPSAQTAFYVLASPILIVRNLINGLICTFPLCLPARYRVTLHEKYVSFGADCEEAQMANAYDAIRAQFGLGGYRCALLHDGHVIYLPPGKAGIDAVKIIRERQTAQAGSVASPPPPASGA